MDTVTEVVNTWENHAVAWEWIHSFQHNAFMKSRMEPWEEVISIKFSGIL
jgi:hypothetical protein